MYPGVVTPAAAGRASGGRRDGDQRERALQLDRIEARTFSGMQLSSMSRGTR